MSTEVELDARTLRGLAHPLRVRLLGELRLHGPSTATRLAERLGESSGATSYHLRQLALYGFVEEEPAAEGREKGPRERWWRAAHQMSRMRAAVFDTDSSMLAEAYLLAVLADNFDLARRAIHELPHLEPQWREGSTVSDANLRLTADELQRLKAELMEVVARYRPADTPTPAVVPAGAEAVVVQVHAFRVPGGARGEST
ncbi:MAG TPA: helix-turn-helix domain-containing protein [Micromonosporaceae bacterium]|nr:helix-turn-helix domain-containing protein [Micromonosporaceae bacterium]